MRGDGWRGSEEMEMDKMRRKREQKMRLGVEGMKTIQLYTNQIKSLPSFVHKISPSLESC
jgi:hypothetical protein